MYAFVDEYGECSLNTENPQQSSRFIPVALLFRDEDVVIAREGAERIRRKHFQKGQIKSSKVGNDHQRRLKILREIVELPIRVCALVVDKDHLYSKGFQFPCSFYKYLCGMLYGQFVLPCPSIQVRADGFGNPEFARSFESYIYSRYPGWESSQNQFDFVAKTTALDVPLPSFQMLKSADDALIQAADFVAGSIARYEDPKKDAGEFASELRTVLSSVIHNIQYWPSVRTHESLLLFDQLDVVDDRVVGLSVRTANNFIRENDNPEKPNIRAQVAVLDILLSELQYDDPKSYVFSEEIIRRIPEISMREDPERYLRSGVIGKLRDRNVPVCSSDQGYKLAASSSDLCRFFTLAEGIITPLLERLQSMRNQVKLTTGNDLDLFEIPAFRHLGAAAAALTDAKRDKKATTNTEVINPTEPITRHRKVSTNSKLSEKKPFTQANRQQSSVRQTGQH